LTIVSKALSRVREAKHKEGKNRMEPDVNHFEPPTAALTAPGRQGLGAASLVARCLLFFALFWIVFYAIFRAFPYLSSGAEVIYRSKLDEEVNGSVFPPSIEARRVLIFGDSRILAGFVPAYFDSLAAADGQNCYSYNSGYPARGFFVPQLKAMVSKRSSVPNILLLTLPWGSAHEGFNVFRLFPDDYDIANRLFPFRDLVRDTFSFLLTSREHGGPRSFYSESHRNVAKMLQDRGYYFISEQSHFPNDSLPDGFHLGSDRPDSVELRSADAESEELKELNRIVENHGIRCYYVPVYARLGQLAPAPETDRPFAEVLRRNSSCKLLGPDYYLYPARMFSDAVHLNREGAKAYTGDIYRLLEKEMLRQ
jgi:hypothetical protein